MNLFWTLFAEVLFKPTLGMIYQTLPLYILEYNNLEDSVYVPYFHFH